eukprot:SAG31_NODE_6390_length_2035_cov_1.973140_4_plen_65_part_00
MAAGATPNATQIVHRHQTGEEVGGARAGQPVGVGRSVGRHQTGKRKHAKNPKAPNSPRHATLAK